MARFVKKTAHGPFELKPQQQMKYICMCGLSKNQPFCDGSHMKTRDEDDTKTYWYSDDGSRKEVCDCGSACCESCKK